MSTEDKISNQGYWKNHFAAWKESNLTQQSYCEQQGISYHSFIYQHHRSKNKLKRASMKFREVKPELPRRSQVAGLQLILPNGIRIGIGGEINAALLQTVLNITQGIKC